MDGPAAKRARQDAGPRPEGVFVVPKEITARIRRLLSEEPPPLADGERSFLLLSWNIDGIDETGEVDTMRRTLAVAEHIATRRPAAVLLQEVIPPQLELLSAPQVLGATYDVVCVDSPRMPYYCAMLLHKRRVRVAAPPRSVHFAESKMGRHYLQVDVVVDGCASAPVTLITTHLESMKQEKAERTRQLTQVLTAMGRLVRNDTPRTVLVAGDLNARDEEVAAARKRAREGTRHVDDVVDAWLWCGSPKKHEFTWDTSQNTNLGVLYQSRCRFDRCLFLASGATDGRGAAKAQQASHGAARGVWVASGFELVGRSKVEGLGRFPSDHWGVEVSWSLAGSCASPLAAREGGPPAEAPVSAAGSSPGPSGAVGQDERTRRREMAAKMAEQRLQANSTRGIGSTLKRKQALSAGGASPRGAATFAAAEGADQRLGAWGANDPPAAAQAEEESEEAMMARAIALSLQSASAEGVSNATAADGAAATGAAGVFGRLAGTGRAAPTTIDLEG